MRYKFFAILIVTSQAIYLPSVMAQGIGEYGRTVGGATQRPGNVSPKMPRTEAQKGKGVFRGVGDVGGRPLPTQLVVAGKAAALYPRQDDETEQLEKLSQGELLVPMIQSTSGSTEWYMVKTPRGTVGWIKSSDVREQAAKKP